MCCQATGDIRERENRQGFYGNGVLQADVFAGYDRLFSAEREGGLLIEAACWAHARRKIHDVYISTQTATAEEALKRIGELYAVEEEIRGLPAADDWQPSNPGVNHCWHPCMSG